MQRTIRILRIALPIAFIGFILVIVFSWDRSAGPRGKQPTAPVTSTQRPDDRPQAEARTFRDVQTIGGRVVSEIVADRVVSFESNWTTLEGVRLTIYRENGLTYVVSCPQAQFNSATKEAEAKGGVRVTSSDGIEIATAEIHYDGFRLTNDIPVQFKVDRWTGNAGALDLDVENETLRLQKQVTALMTPANPAETPMTLKGKESFFNRRQNTVEFRDQVVMDRGPDSVKADWIIGRFTQDRRQLIGVEGDGHCEIVMAANPQPGEDLGGRKQIFSDGFITEVGPDGKINAINARSAQNAAHAILDGPPMRDIVARGFRIAIGANRAVSEIKADWQVVMKELGPEPRQINAEHVTVSFDETTRRARTAYLEGAFRYSDPKTTASAFRAHYDINGDRIVLTTDAGWQATVVSDGQVLKAKQIEFAPKAQTARATGSVIAQLASKGKGPTADATNLFPAGEPVFVNADLLMMRQQDKVAHFTGNVKAWQKDNTILSAELQIQGNGEIVTARGNVRTLLYNTGSEQRKVPVQSKSDQLVARKGDRRIDLLGAVSIQDETRNLKSDKAQFFFDQARKIQRIEALTSVFLTETATGRKGTGDKAIYHVDKKMIYLFGNPATISEGQKGSVEGEQIALDLTKNRVYLEGEKTPTKGTYKADG